MSSFHDYCVDWFIEHLERDIEAHQSGRVWEVGASDNDTPPYDEIADEEQASRLGAAWNFRDRWMDARNHDWGYYPGVAEADWPIIARQIVRGLREGWSSEQMMDNAVFNPPLAPPRQSWWRRVFGGG